MAKMVLLASYLSIDSNDLSSYCNKIEVTADVDEKDVTTFGSSGWKEVLGGLKGGSVGISFKNDLAAAAVDAIMWALLGTVVTFSVRADNGSVSTSNPSYSGSILVKEWKPIMGNVGDVNQLDVTYPTSGAVARATA